MEVPKVPPCQRCGCELELATVMSAFGDRPSTYIFRCPQCKRHAPYYRDEDGERRVLALKQASLNQVVGTLVVPVGPRPRGIPDGLVPSGQFWPEGRVEENHLFDVRIFGETAKYRHVFLATHEGDFISTISEHAVIPIDIRSAPTLEWRRHWAERNVVLGKQELGAH